MKRKPFPYRKHPEFDELLEEKYGFWSLKRFANEIFKRYGYEVSEFSVKERAIKIGVSIYDAHGYFYFKEAARDMGIHPSTVWSVYKRKQLKALGVKGRGRVLYFPPATMAALRLYFDQKTPQFLRMDELAAHLKRPRGWVERACEAGRIETVRVLGELRVPAPEALRVAEALRDGTWAPKLSHQEARAAVLCPSCDSPCRYKGSHYYATEERTALRYQCARSCGRYHRRDRAGAVLPPVDRQLIKQRHPWAA